MGSQTPESDDSRGFGKAFGLHSGAWLILWESSNIDSAIFLWMDRYARRTAKTRS